jgi:hypothetical protein
MPDTGTGYPVKPDTGYPARYLAFTTKFLVKYETKIY